MTKILDFMKFRKIAIATSGLLMFMSIFSLFYKGFNFGLDFTGGSLVELRYENDVSNINNIKNLLNKQLEQDVTVQFFGTPKDILIRVQTDESNLGNKIENILKENSTETFTIKKVEFVGPQVGKELRDQGGIAILVSIIGILIYISLRFQWKCSIGAVLSLIHDVIIVLGFISWLEIQFDLTTLAAILSLIGYSLNDTIIIYDRIRENFRVLRGKLLIENINISINQTLGRVFATSVSTMMALLSMVIFGGSALYIFAIILIVGIIVGTYSSLMISTYILIYQNLTTQDFIKPVIQDEDDLSDYNLK